MISAIDITTQATQVLNIIIGIIQWIFATLANIEMFNTNLLQIFATIVILGCLMPVLITIPTGTITSLASYNEGKKKEANEEEEIRKAVHRQYINEKAKKIRSKK